MDAPERMLDKGEQPTIGAVAEWLGARAFKRWVELTDFIEDTRSLQGAGCLRRGRAREGGGDPPVDSLAR